MDLWRYSSKPSTSSLGFCGRQILCGVHLANVLLRMKASCFILQVKNIPNSHFILRRYYGKLDSETALLLISLFFPVFALPRKSWYSSLVRKSYPDQYVTYIVLLHSR